MRLSRVPATTLATVLCAVGVTGCGGGGDDGPDRKADDAGASVVNYFSKAITTCDLVDRKDELQGLLVDESKDDFDFSAESEAECKKSETTFVEAKRDGLDDDSNPVWSLTYTDKSGGGTDQVAAVQTGDGWALDLDPDD